MKLRGTSLCKKQLNAINQENNKEMPIIEKENRKRKRK